MTYIRKRPGWQIPESEAASEGVFGARRRFLEALGLAGAGLLAGSCAGAADKSAPAGAPPVPGSKGQGAVLAAMQALPGRYPAARNARFTLDRPITPEETAARYNNFYEFGNDKDALVTQAQELTLRPWTVRVDGLVEKPGVWDVDTIVRTMPVEERLYRHRCVERWSMAVPWTGVPFKAFVERLRPLSSAKFVKFVSFLRPEEAIGQRRDTWYPWPYYEGLSIPEAINELTLLTTGVYGHPLPPQHGAPIRIVTPWKYGYKSIKSIVKIEFTATQPGTFWNDLQPLEYGFESNVDPTKPHPRWSQAREQMLGTDVMRPTLPYNGYGEWVAGLYA